ncbi:MAG: hypothetical protein V7719_05875 [Psychroserpens sp.]|uniref:hypothetical protein n=1 Tax=Psychroserpens sp. TaxID=2020870 RepID=UPI0030034623
MQARQAVSNVLLGYIFDFAIRLYIRLTIKLTNDTIVGLDFGFTNWRLSRNAHPDIIEINFNIVAIFYYSIFQNTLTELKLNGIK